MRGAGEVLGTRQTGTVEFRVADPLRDQRLVAAAQRAADLILERYPELVEPLIRRWLGRREELWAGVSCRLSARRARRPGQRSQRCRRSSLCHNPARLDRPSRPPVPPLIDHVQHRATPGQDRRPRPAPS